jgi:DNA-binding XRE family transcriptional regulator
VTAVYGELVRSYRVAAGLTQEELAALCGLDVRTISDIERGRTARPHRSTADLLARALGRDDLAYEAARARRLAVAEVPGYPSVTSGHGDGLRCAQGPQPAVDVFSVTIGHYADADLVDLEAEAWAGRLADLLAPFGSRYRPWRHPVRDRGADAVQQRLREWFGPQAPAADAGAAAGSSVLYWAGHGWSEGTRSALAHAGSPAVVDASGLDPRQLAQAIRTRQAAAETPEEAGGTGGWALVIMETSHATAIADAVMAALHGSDAPGRCSWLRSQAPIPGRRAGLSAC